MFSRWHPAATGGWTGVRRGVKWGGGWLPALLLSIGLVAAVFPALRLETQGSEDGRSSSALYRSPLANICYGTYHVVRAGETVYSIAQAYGSTAYRIRYCNGLSSYTVRTGQTLLVPIQRTRR